MYSRNTVEVDIKDKKDKKDDHELKKEELNVNGKELEQSQNYEKDETIRRKVDKTANENDDGVTGSEEIKKAQSIDKMELNAQKEIATIDFKSGYSLVSHLRDSNLLPEQLSDVYMSIINSSTPTSMSLSYDSIIPMDETPHLVKLYTKKAFGKLPSSESIDVDMRVNYPMIMNNIFKEGVSHALLGLDSNIPGVVMKFDPFTLEYVSDNEANIDKIVSVGNTVTKSVLNSSNSLIKLQQIVFSIFNNSHRLGHYRLYAIDAPVFSDDLGVLEKAISSITDTNNFQLPIDRFGKGGVKSISLGRLTMKQYPAIEDVYVGNIPNDDVLRYPHHLYTLKTVLPSEAMKRFYEPFNLNAFGSISRTAQTFQAGVKMTEQYKMFTDSPLKQINTYYNRYRETITMDVQGMIELLKSMTIDYSEIEGSLRLFDIMDFQAFNMTGYDVFKNDLVFPSDRENLFEDSYRLTFNMLPEILNFAFSNTITELTEALNSVKFDPLNSVLTVMNPLEAQLMNQANSNMVTIISVLINGNSMDGQKLAVKLAVSMMGPYAMTAASVRSVKKDKDSPIGFLFELLGLTIARVLYYNYFKWNKSSWIALVSDFLLNYFPETYSGIFTVNGYGTIGRNIVKSLSSQTRVSLTGMIWYLDRDLATSNRVLNNVARFLQLERNPVAVTTVVDKGRYRVNSRNVRLIGRTYSPMVNDDRNDLPNPRTLPMYAELSTAFALAELFTNSKGLAAKLMKSTLGAITSAFGNANKFMESFAEFFHYVLCPIYEKVARSPLLIHNDYLNPETPAYYGTSFGYADRDNNSPLHGFVAMYLPPISASMFSNMAVQECISMYLTSYAPCGTVRKGVMVNEKNLDYTFYTGIYNNTNFKNRIMTYAKQMYTAQRILEVYSLGARIVDPETYNGLTIRQMMTDVFKISSLPVANYANLLNVLGIKTDTAKSINFGIDTRLGILSDVRIKQPAPARQITPGNVIVEDDFRRVYHRDHIFDSAMVILRLLFSEGGMYRFVRSYTISGEIFPSLDAQTKHNTVFPVARILRENLMEVDGRMRIMHKMEVDVDGIQYTVFDINDLIKKLRDSGVDQRMIILIESFFPSAKTIQFANEVVKHGGVVKKVNCYAKLVLETSESKVDRSREIEDYIRQAYEETVISFPEITVYDTLQNVNYIQNSNLIPAILPSNPEGIVFDYVLNNVMNEYVTEPNVSAAHFVEPEEPGPVDRYPEGADQLQMISFQEVLNYVPITVLPINLVRYAPVP